MWVSRKEWEMLQEKLASMDRRQGEFAEALSNRTQIRVYEDRPLSLYSVWSEMGKEDLPVTEVIQRILTHLNLKLCYHKGKSSSVEVCKLEKKKV